MANQWLRLWHDMPNDPKWRTIARVSGQPVGLVLAVYVHVLVNASNANERGRTQNLNSEDIASAIDADVEQVDSILSAMQSRVLDGDIVSGWEKRQPAREDGSAERSKAWRNNKKATNQGKTNTNERKRTQANAKKRPDTDTDTDTEDIKETTSLVSDEPLTGEIIPLRAEIPFDEIRNAWLQEAKSLAEPRDVSTWTAGRKTAIRKRWHEQRKAGAYSDTAGGIAYWRGFFAQIERSDFLAGRVPGKDGGQPFKANIDWVFKPDKFQKIIEGCYANAPRASPVEARKPWD